MRKVMLLAALLAACTTAETPEADTSAVTAATPGTLTAADVAGNWTGTSMLEGSDSVVSRWTAVRESDSMGKLVTEGSTDSVAYTLTFDADSMVATSVPYPDSTIAGGAQVKFRSVGRLSDGRLIGTAVTTLATMPDSVVSRTRWEATRAP
ncbi:MAG: hypothetical protein M3373_10465 [Gemmatimonadota bacterium]|nr:hypothetical protein [Gemmatimonadota bacterium]